MSVYGLSMDTPLRNSRIRLGLTLSELAGIVGFSQGYLSKLERRLVPTVDLRDARRLADAYEVTLDEFEESLPPCRPGRPVASRERPKRHRRRASK